MSAAKSPAVPPQRRSPLTLRNWRDANAVPPDQRPESEARIDCGWGRLLFAHTFDSAEALAAELANETPGKRDIAFYLRDPHVVVSVSPQTLFLDPSHTYRIWLDQYHPSTARSRQFIIRKIRPRREGPAADAIYKARGMVEVGTDFWHRLKDTPAITVLVAEDKETSDTIGVVFGVDHVQAFSDPENGSSLWALAVDPAARHNGIGEALTRHLAEHSLARGRAFMDLSVVHDNTDAIAMYEKLDFRRVPVFSLKTKNSINTTLFSGPSPDSDLNPYARIVVDEARLRGINVKVLDAENGFFRLTHGGHSVTCRESLSSLTSAVAMSLCDNKAATRKVLTDAGLKMPGQMTISSDDDLESLTPFIKRYGRVVVKPARGEQGAGVSVDLRSLDTAVDAVHTARKECGTVLVEEFVEGDDLRVVVIDREAVAAAIRRPPEIVGTGQDTARRLIEKQSRRREAATDGESRIPLDEETERFLRAAGYGLDDVPASGERIVLRKAANLHTGGTIHDVTDDLHPDLARAAIAAADALEIPVVGIDMLVPDVSMNAYHIIEANERPGLANHEPQPTAEKFLDLLFPITAAAQPIGPKEERETK